MPWFTGLSQTKALKQQKLIFLGLAGSLQSRAGRFSFSGVSPSLLNIHLFGCCSGHLFLEGPGQALTFGLTLAPFSASPLTPGHSPY